MNVSGPDVPFMLAFEEEFDPENAKAWMQQWWQASVVCSAIYAIVIHAGQYAMSERPAFQVRGLMVAWSAVLAVFSICGTIRVIPTLFHIYNNYGAYYMICSSRFYYFPGSGFWTYAFAVSKLFELGDTAFIVLRKQKLSFLHWYHHVTVFVYCWFSYAYDSPSGNVFGGMNYFIHSLMYTYYTLRALRIRLPNVLSMILTSLQIVQMFIGVSVSVAIYTIKHRGGSCAETNNNLALAFVMYFTYLLLFAHFFYEKYMLTAKHPPKDTRNGVKVATNGVKVKANGVKATSNGTTVTNGSNGLHINGFNNNTHKTHSKSD